MLAGAWTFGWDALVAIGTLSLAGVTAGLAWTTRKVARADTENLRAQWRPMLVPTRDPTFESHQETGNWVAGIPIMNSGRGPALFVRAMLEPVNFSPDSWSLGSFSPGESRPLQFSNLPRRDERYQLLLDYRDLAGRQYSSAIVIDFPSNDQRDPGRFYNVELYEDRSLTPHGEYVPQTGITDVQPPETRPLRPRLRAAFAAGVAAAKEAFRPN